MVAGEAQEGLDLGGFGRQDRCLGRKTKGLRGIPPVFVEEVSGLEDGILPEKLDQLSKAASLQGTESGRGDRGGSLHSPKRVSSGPILGKTLGKPKEDRPRAAPVQPVVPKGGGIEIGGTKTGDAHGP